MHSPLMRKIIDSSTDILARNTGSHKDKMNDDAIEKLIVREWWTFNGCPVWFRHTDTAKLVRRACPGWMDIIDV